MKRLRSILYVPGHKPALILKAARAGADAVCLVLEDSVPRDRRAEARTIVADAILELVAGGTTTLVKVNALHDGLEDDLEAIVQPGLTAVVLPKVTSADDIVRGDRLIAAAEDAKAVERGRVEVVVMVETPAAVVFAYDIAMAASRVVSLACGVAAHGDLAGALGMEPSADGHERLYIRSKVLVDARAAGVQTPLDGVWAGIGDLDGLAADARSARSLGYRGKFVIHPEQVEPINRIFGVSDRELDWGRRVIDAFEAAENAGDAAIVVDGQMIDYAMVETARSLLDLAAAFRPDGESDAGRPD